MLEAELDSSIPHFSLRALSIILSSSIAQKVNRASSEVENPQKWIFELFTWLPELS